MLQTESEESEASTSRLEYVHGEASEKRKCELGYDAENEMDNGTEEKWDGEKNVIQLGSPKSTCGEEGSLEDHRGIVSDQAKVGNASVKTAKSVETVKKLNNYDVHLEPEKAQRKSVHLSKF